MADDRIHNKIDKLEEKFDSRMDRIEIQLESLDKQMTVYNSELSRHIEGVQLAREENKELKYYIEKETEVLEKRLAPVESHVIFIQNALSLIMKIAGASGALIAIAIGLKELGLL